jgi:ABC-type uncharacterized transport system permease subunit
MSGVSGTSSLPSEAASAAQTGAAAPEPRLQRSPISKLSRGLIVAGVLITLLSFTRVLTGANELTSSGTMGTTLRLTIPIMLAGLAGLWSERVGIVNIGIEGMMVFGTWFGGFGAWKYGAWVGLLLGVLGGAIGGLIHALAVVRFNVDHVISGVALNLLAVGGMRYASATVFDGKKGGSISKSPGRKSAIPDFNIPFLAGGKIGSWKSPDMLGWLEKHHWFIVSDVSGLARGLMRSISAASIIALLLVAVTAFVLWRTRFGLRLRSSGEAPAAAESLGVKVIPLRYIALAISGGFAGLGGAFVAVVSTGYYQQGQTLNRGFIGLATMIFGNWRPAGVLGGAALFGFADALKLLGSDKTIPALFLFMSFVAGLFVIIQLYRRKRVPAAVAFIAGGLFLTVYLAVDKVPSSLTQALPYAITLIVLAAASQRLRPPAHDGLPYRSGESH